MSATELIWHVAALPPQEKALFIELVHVLENGTPTTVPSNGGVAPASPPPSHRTTATQPEISGG